MEGSSSASISVNISFRFPLQGDRSGIYEQGMALLRKEFPDVQILTELAATFTVIVAVPSHRLEALREFLKKDDVGTVFGDKPVSFRFAGSSSS